MIDHLGIQVADVDRSAALFDALLATLEGKRMMEIPTEAGAVIGYGSGEPSFWISPVTTDSPGRETHVAFVAPGRPAVRAFHQAAVAAGVEVLHAPRLWPEYHPTYYAVFVRDLDGNNIEAVCHVPE